VKGGGGVLNAVGLIKSEMNQRIGQNLCKAVGY